MYGFICTFIFTYVYTYIYMHMYTYIRVYKICWIRVYPHTNTWIHIRVHVSSRLIAHTCICEFQTHCRQRLYVCMYARVRVAVRSTWKHKYIHIHVDPQIHKCIHIHKCICEWNTDCRQRLTWNVSGASVCNPIHPLHSHSIRIHPIHPLSAIALPHVSASVCIPSSTYSLHTHIYSTHIYPYVLPLTYTCICEWKTDCRQRVYACTLVCVLQCVAVCCGVLRCVWSSSLMIADLDSMHVHSCAWCVAVCCSTLQCVVMCCGLLRCVAVCYSVLQHGWYARGCMHVHSCVCCGVLQCVAVCCSVLQ